MAQRSTPPIIPRNYTQPKILMTIIGTIQIKHPRIHPIHYILHHHRPHQLLLAAMDGITLPWFPII